MKHTATRQVTTRLTMTMTQRYLLPLCIAALALVGCGGGASNTSSSGSGTTSSSTAAILTLSVKNTATTPIETNSLAAGGTARAYATFKTAAGVAIPNAVVTFTVSGLSTLVPANGTALTDSNGMASVDVVANNPNAGGAFAVKATGVKGTSTAVASEWNMGVGAASITLGAASHLPVSSATTKLQAGQSTLISVNVLSGGVPVSSGATFTVSSTCSAQSKAVLTPVGLVNGVFKVSYQNLGCTASPDVVTITEASGVSTTATIYVEASSLAQMQLTGVTPQSQSLVIKGGGGYGRVEAGTVTFTLLDNSQQPLQGVTVNFSLSSTAGGLSLVVPSIITGPSGTATATVQSGTSPTPFVVLAQASYVGGNGITVNLSASSSLMNVSVGLPEQKNMSFSADKYNIEGLNYDGTIANLTVRMADFWGNKVADGTAVNMITEGGVIGASTSGACTTVDGTCSLSLSSQSFKPANGRVSIVSYAQGPLSFNDTSGVGNFNYPGTTCYHFGDPFLDYDESGDRTPDAATLIANNFYTNIVTPTPNVVGVNGFTYPLYPNLSESFVPYVSGPYVGPTSGLPCGTTRPLRYIQKRAVFVFSGSHVLGATIPAASTFTWPLNGSNFSSLAFAGYSDSSGNRLQLGCSDRFLNVQVFDENFNPMPAGTKLAAEVTSSLSGAKIVPDEVLSTTAIGGTSHSIEINVDSTKCASPGTTGYVTIKSTTPKGLVTSFRIPVTY